MTDPAPTIWLLTDGQPGNLTQIEGLAAHLADRGADAQVKRLQSNRWHMLGAALLGASTSLGARDPLGSGPSQPEPRVIWLIG